MNERARRRPNLAEYAPARTSNTCLGRERTRVLPPDSTTASPVHRTSERRSAAVPSGGRFVCVCRVCGSVRWWRGVVECGSGCSAHVCGRCGWTRVPSSDVAAASSVHWMGGRCSAGVFSGVCLGCGCRVCGSVWQSLTTLQPSGAWIGGVGVVARPVWRVMGCITGMSSRLHASAETRCASGCPEGASMCERRRGRVVG
jgi:hypothetical protein